MKRCPRCPRTYSDQLSYCLDDGSVLVPYSDQEETAVYPGPAPEPLPPRKQGNWIIRILGVVLVFFTLGIVGLLIAGIWWASRGNNNANSNSASRSVGSGATPSPTHDPLSLLASPSPEPSPESSPVASPVEPTIEPGTYQCEVTRKIKSGDRQVTATLRIKVTLNSDGTYFQQAYMTIHGTAIEDQLAIEEKGNYTQTDDVVLLKDKLSREFNLNTNNWSAWGPPREGQESREQIRNVTATTFQLYDSEEKDWFTFSKV